MASGGAYRGQGMGADLAAHPSMAPPAPPTPGPMPPTMAMPPQPPKQEVAQSMVAPPPPIPQPAPPTSMPEDPITANAMNPNESLFDDSPMTANEQANLDATSGAAPPPPNPQGFQNALSSLKAPTTPEVRAPSAPGIPATNQNGMQDVLAFLLGKSANGGGDKPRPGLSALLGG
jgi:hypothetical protein